MQDNPTQQNSNSTRRLPLLFIALALVSAVWVVGPRGWFPTWHGFPNTAQTTVFFLAGAAAAGSGVPGRYRWSIVAGLGCSAVGDAFLMLPDDYFVAGLRSFLAAHACYLWAFTCDNRLAGHRLPFVAAGVVGVVLVVWLWPGVAISLRVPVLVYAAALLAMAAQATSRALSRRDVAAILAAVGAVLFVVSDAGLAVQRFRQPLEWGRVIVLGTYFVAQSGIALSVVFHRRKPG